MTSSKNYSSAVTESSSVASTGCTNSRKGVDFQGDHPNEEKIDEDVVIDSCSTSLATTTPLSEWSYSDNEKNDQNHAINLDKSPVKESKELSEKDSPTKCKSSLNMTTMNISSSSDVSNSSQKTFTGGITGKFDPYIASASAKVASALRNVSAKIQKTTGIEVSASAKSLGYAELREEFPREELQKSEKYAVSLANSSSKSLSELIPDGGYGWVVVAASCVLHMLILGNMFSFGIYYPIYAKEFSGSEMSIALIGSIGAACLNLFGTISGALADYYSNERIILVGSFFITIGLMLSSLATSLWQLHLTQGFLVGIGYSLSFMPALSVVGQWFNAHRGFAMGIAIAGGGVGQFLVSMLTQTLLDRYGWRMTLRVIAALMFVGIISCSLLIRRLMPLTHTLVINISPKLLHDRNLLLLSFIAFLNCLGMFVPYNILVVYSIAQGLSVASAVLILSMVGIASAAGRVMIGFFADRVGKIVMLRVCFAGSGISTMCWMACKDFQTIMVYAILFGYFAGGVVSMIPNTAAEIIGARKLGPAIGMVYTMSSLGVLISAPLAGILFDALHSYYPSIALSGGFLLAGFVFSLFLRPKPKETKLKERFDDKIASHTQLHERLQHGRLELLGSDNGEASSTATSDGSDRHFPTGSEVDEHTVYINCGQNNGDEENQVDQAPQPHIVS